MSHIALLLPWGLDGLLKVPMGLQGKQVVGDDGDHWWSGGAGAAVFPGSAKPEECDGFGPFLET